MFVWADFVSARLACFKNRYILSNIRGIFFFFSLSFPNTDHSFVSFHVDYPVAKMIEIIENSYFTPHGD